LEPKDEFGLKDEFDLMDQLDPKDEFGLKDEFDPIDQLDPHIKLIRYIALIHR